MTVALQMRPLVEVVRAGEDLLLLRGPAGGDCRLRAPSPVASALIERLITGGGTPAALATQLRAQGLSTTSREMRQMLEALDAAELLEPVSSFPADDRLSRQRLYLRERRPRDGDTREMERALRSAQVVVIGCGGLGSWAAAGLACIGIGSLTLIDFDIVELSNLNRQLLFREDDLGRRKVLAATDALRAFDHELDVTPIDTRIACVDDARALVAGHDVAIACADEPPYEIARWINDACQAEGVPHISAGQLPPTVRVGPLVLPGRTACVRCLETALRAQNPLYEQLESLRREDRRPQATLGPASGIAGQLMAMDVMHHLTGVAAPATLNAVWSMDLRDLRSEIVPVERVPGCPGCS